MFARRADIVSPLCEKTLSTGAELAGIQNSQQSCKQQSQIQLPPYDHCITTLIKCYISRLSQLITRYKNRQTSKLYWELMFLKCFSWLCVKIILLPYFYLRHVLLCFCCITAVVRGRRLWLRPYLKSLYERRMEQGPEPERPRSVWVNWYVAWFLHCSQYSYGHCSCTFI